MADNKFEIAFRQKTQSKALDNLKLIIVVFSCVQAYCLVYSIVMFILKANCEYPTDSIFWAIFVWTMTRSIQYLIWVYPIMYIFWPRSLKHFIVKKCKCCLSKERQNRHKAVAQENKRDGQNPNGESSLDSFDNVDFEEDEYAVDSWSSDKEERKGSDEDEWMQTNRKKDASEVLWLGTSPADVEDIEPASELVRRSMEIIKLRNKTSTTDRLHLIELHGEESDVDFQRASNIRHS